MYHIAAFYSFFRFEDKEAQREPLREFAAAREICGTILLANEGVNGTVAAPTEQGILELMQRLRSLPGNEQMEYKRSTSERKPFHRLKVRLKKEIVTMGVTDLDPSQEAGEYVPPEEWNSLIEDPETIVVDTRNDYEVRLGTFERAINPKTERFGEFPQWVKENLADARDKPIAMFCTGGIRCEKATAYLRREGFKKVYHLQGGILKYLEQVPEEQSRWNGECFVFDERVSVANGVREGRAIFCRICNKAFTPEDDTHIRKENDALCCATCGTQLYPQP